MYVGGVDIGFPEVGRKLDLRREAALLIGNAGVEGLDTLDLFVGCSRLVLTHGSRVVDFEIDLGIGGVVQRNGSGGTGSEIEFVPWFFRIFGRVVV